MNFIIDVTHCGVSVAQWYSIGVHVGTQNLFFVLCSYFYLISVLLYFLLTGYEYYSLSTKVWWYRL